MGTPMQSVEFEFAKDWIHAGKEYRPGVRVGLPENEAEKLERLGAGRCLKPPKRKSKPTPEAGPEPASSFSEN
jgi:hypothetical protein